MHLFLSFRKNSYLCGRQKRSKSYVEQKITPYKGRQGPVRPPQIGSRQHDGLGKDADGLRRQSLRPLLPDADPSRRSGALRRAAAGAGQAEEAADIRRPPSEYQIRRQRRHPRHRQQRLGERPRRRPQAGLGAVPGADPHALHAAHRKRLLQGVHAARRALVRRRPPACRDLLQRTATVRRAGRRAGGDVDSLERRPALHPRNGAAHALHAARLAHGAEGRPEVQEPRRSGVREDALREVAGHPARSTSRSSRPTGMSSASSSWTTLSSARP